MFTIGLLVLVAIILIVLVYRRRAKNKDDHGSMPGK
jgi:heme/copper-type cytochrome/quinol oxidase subunit 2